MSWSVTHNGTDISQYVMEYTRTKRICSGVGICMFTLASTYPTTILPYNTFVVYEDGIKKGTFFVSSVSKDLPGFTISVQTQDITKQLADYFIDEVYEINYPSTSRYWLEKFLTDAKVSYSFLTSDTGHAISENTSMGGEALLERVQILCMENGWYFLADPDNVLVIGKLDVDYSTQSDTLNDIEITDELLVKDDKMLRNRILVRGTANPFTKIWVSGEVKIITPWNYDSNDYRSTLIQSADVEDVAIATQLANQVLNETRKITEVKSVKAAGFYNLSCGNVAYINGSFYNGYGLITSIQVKVTDRGATTTLILDERCPRLFGYAAGTGDVFIGTEGAGVWRKPMKTVHTWEDYSTGLSELNIEDLSVANGIKACVANHHLYTRTPLDTGWVRQYPSITVSGISVSDPYCTDVVVNKQDSLIQAVFTDDVTYSGGSRSWLYQRTPAGATTVVPITISGELENVYAYGIDNDTDATYLSVGRYITTSGTGGGGGSLPIPSGWVWNECSCSPHVSHWTEPGKLCQNAGIYSTWPLPEVINEQGNPIWYQRDYWEYQRIAKNENQWVQATSLSKIKGQAKTGKDSGGSAIYVSFLFDGYWMVSLERSDARGDTVGKSFEFTVPPEHVGHRIYTIIYVAAPTNAIGDLDDDYECWLSNLTLEDWEVHDEPDLEDGTGTNPWYGYIYYLLKYKEENFESIIQLINAEKVEISQTGPIILFGGDPDYNNGYLQTYSQLEPEATTIFASGYVSDVRGASILTEEGLSPVGLFCIHPNSGIINQSNLYYTDFSNTITSGVNYGGPYVLDGTIQYTPEWHQYTLAEFHTFSGIINNIETTNYSYDIPYMFVSSRLNNDNIFYQRDGRMLPQSENEWIERNDNLPSSKITCIRVDDRV